MNTYDCMDAEECVYVCVCVCLCVNLYIHGYVCVSAWGDLCARLWVCVLCVSMRGCVYICEHMCISVCVDGGNLNISGNVGVFTGTRVSLRTCPRVCRHGACVYVFGRAHPGV